MKDLEKEMNEIQWKIFYLNDHPELQRRYPMEYDQVYDRLVDRYISLKEQHRKVYKD